MSSQDVMNLALYVSSGGQFQRITRSHGVINDVDVVLTPSAYAYHNREEPHEVLGSINRIRMPVRSSVKPKRSAFGNVHADHRHANASSDHIRSPGWSACWQGNRTAPADRAWIGPNISKVIPGAGM